MSVDADPEIFARMKQVYEALITNGTYEEILGEVMASTRGRMSSDN